MALLGVIVGFALIVHGSVSLPDIVPTHIGVGGVDSYGSKWNHLIFISILLCVFYGGITLINHYLYLFYHPADPKAQPMYHIYQEIFRVYKLIIIWLLVLFTALYMIAMQKKPEAALACIGIIVVFTMMSVVYPTLFIVISLTSKLKK